ncbi:MAG TPA: peptide deformylase [Gemmataceae bacterium]|nr:peptide deformylase [Gemmataceae bacterium]
MKIVVYPHPALRHPAKPLAAIDKQIHLDAGRMLELMYEHKGLGLAANQVFLPYRIVVLNPSGDPQQRDKEEVLLNPVVLERKGAIEGEEGCLSFPGLFQKIRRAKTVRVQAYNLRGEVIDKSVSDLESRLWQHEVDHLDGILFIDKMGAIARLASRNALKELEQDFQRAQDKGELPATAQLERILKERSEAMNKNGSPPPPDDIPPI